MKAFFRRNLIFFITFAVAFVIMFSAFAVNGMYPFGDKQILVIDAWHQYYPFLMEYHQKLQTGGSLLYNHNIGLGVNFMLLGSYYTNSPLNLLSIFVPHSLIREFMLVTTVMKIAFAATFMAILLHYLYGKKNITVMIFGLMYAFSAFFMGYYWCIMWLDSAALLPLIIMGMHKVLRGENEALYIITLALAIIANYYIAFMICLFVAFYYIYLCFTHYKPYDMVNFLSQSFYILFYSVLGVALSAFVLIPTASGMSLASSAKISFPKTLKFERDFMSVFHRLLTGVKPEIVEVKGGLPNIASGTLSLYMLYLYFKSRTVKLSEKIAGLGMILFLMLGFTTNIFNFIWHGFHFPNGIPFRFSFVFSFFIITLGYRAFHDLEDFKPRDILTFMGVMICYLLYVEERQVHVYVVLITILTLVCFGVVLTKYLEGKTKRSAFALSLAILVALESLGTAIYGVATTGFSKRSTYRLYEQNVNAALAEMRRIDKGHYRTEMARLYTTNDASLYGYRGASVFSSTLNSNVTRFVRKLGAMGDGASNRYSLPMSSPILDSLFNIKYFIGRNELWGAEFTGYTEMGSWNRGTEKEPVEPIRLLRNDYVLPLGFYVPAEVATYEDGSFNPFKVQESLYSRMSGETVDIYHQVAPNVRYDNADGRVLSEGQYSFTLKDSGKNAKAFISHTFAEDGDYYIYCYSPGTGNGVYKIRNDRTATVRKENYEVRRGVIVPTGKMKAGGSVDIELELDKGYQKNFDLVIVKAEFDAFEEAFHRINAHPFEIIKFEDRRIEGKITAPEKGYAFISIPYERGWSAKVNGTLVSVTGLKNAMILVPVNKGLNRIELSYFPEGLRGGLMISGFALLSVIIIVVFGSKLSIGYTPKKKASDTERGGENASDIPSENSSESSAESSTESSAETPSKSSSESRLSKTDFPSSTQAEEQENLVHPESSAQKNEGQ
ncbi:MAG: YfhO family protein [Bacillota bacterium]|nr:YfhO family protein [Bacillota bacterium]